MTGYIYDLSATAVLKAGIESGELVSTFDTDVSLDAQYGGLNHRAPIPHAPLTPKFAQQLADSHLRTQSRSKGVPQMKISDFRLTSNGDDVRFGLGE
jgi:hypothetical protein